MAVRSSFALQILRIRRVLHQVLWPRYCCAALVATYALQMHSCALIISHFTPGKARAPDENPRNRLLNIGSSNSALCANCWQRQR